MRKFLIVLFLLISFGYSVNAQELVLSDIIQQAREAQRVKLVKEKSDEVKAAISNSAAEAKSINEQNAVEKLDIKESSCPLK